MGPKSPLVRPREYFETRLEPLGPGLGVFALYIVGMAIFSYAVIRLVFAQVENLPPEGQRAMARALPQVLGTFVVILVVTAVIGLLVVAAIMHVFSASAESDGSFADAIAVAGWAYAPDVLAVPVNYLLAWRYARGLTLDGSDPETLVAQVESLQAPTGIAEGLLALVVVAWSVYILAYGTAGTHDADIEQTILPALLVGVGSLLFRLL